jgi:hypothetical protein
MKLEYVESSDIGGAGRKPSFPWAEFFEELYKDGSKTRWGVFPIKIKSPSAAYVAAKRFKDIKIRCNRNEDGLWTVYGQYQPSDDEEVF